MFLPRCIIALGFAVLLGGPGGASAAMPLVTGDFQGNFALKTLKGAPPLAWRVQLKPDGNGGLLGNATAHAPGLALEIVASLSSDEKTGTWKVTQGTLDAAAWSSILMAQSVTGKPATDMKVMGTLAITGGGTWSGSEFTGELMARLEDGTASSAAQGWDVGGISLQSVIALNPSGYDVRTITATAATLNAGGVAGRNFQLDAVGEGTTLTVKRVELEVLAGKVSLSPFVVNLLDPSVKTTAELTAVALSDLIHYLPPALSQADGLVGGKVNIDWSARFGLQTAGGSLVISPDSPASLKLVSTPGFLTGSMPERLQLLPAKAGFLARWFSLNNPAYDMLKRIELGQASLRVENLQVQLYPDGPGAPRSVRIDVLARPEDGSVVKSVKFEINVMGTLDQVIKLGSAGGLKINASAKVGK